MSITSRPAIGDEQIDQIKAVMAGSPGINRTQLSRKLCELWDWRYPTGDLKDMSCRDVLRSLDAKGKIVLPEPMKKGGHISNKPRAIARLEHDTAPIVGQLKDIMPLSVEIVGKEGRAEFLSMLSQYHYLSIDRTVGRNMMYMVREKGGRPVALLLFGSAAWKCMGRDEHIGWNHKTRQDNLQLITNNSRFLIPQWVRVPCLASHALSQISMRISADWQARYGHPIICLETFVDEQYEGTVYKAANWAYVGKTTGRGRNDTRTRRLLTIKSMYLYPLVRNYRKLLCSETCLAK